MTEHNGTTMETETAEAEWPDDSTMGLAMRAPAETSRAGTTLSSGSETPGILLVGGVVLRLRHLGCSGSETGNQVPARYLLEHGGVWLLVSAPLGPSSPIADHVRAHGDGVRDLAIRVTSAPAAYDAARPMARRGRRVLADHRRGRLRQGDPRGLDRWVDFYRLTLGFEELAHFDDHEISTPSSVLMSTVVWGRSRIVLSINEPAPGLGKSQIQEYLECYGSPGVQHLALSTNEIVSTE